MRGAIVGRRKLLTKHSAAFVDVGGVHAARLGDDRPLMLNRARRFCRGQVVAGVLGVCAMGTAQSDPRTTLLGPVGAGYGAKIAGAAVLVAGRSLESVQAAELAAEGPLAAVWGAIEYGLGERDVSATIFGVTRTAVAVSGLGSCLLPAGFDRSELPNVGELPPRPVRPPEEVALADGFDVERLGEAMAAAFANPDARTRAVVVLREGKLVAERYADGFDRQTRLAGWSMTKSLVNALVGARVASGEMELGAPVGLEVWAEDTEDPRQMITVEHALRMVTGLDWVENYIIPSSDVPQMLFVRPGAGAYAMTKEAVRDPGERWRYSSGTTNILCAALRESFPAEERGRSYWLYPRRVLFDRIGMTSAVIEADATGTFVGSSFSFMTARDWARFGQLYLQDGVWEGERILPDGWVQSTVTPTEPSGGRYGMHFWLNRSDASGRRSYPGLPADLFYADGYEGQMVAIFPTQKLVVARLGCTRAGGVWHHGSFLRMILDALDDHGAREQEAPASQPSKR